MKEDIDRIAGRMVHRRDAAKGFLEDVESRKREIERRGAADPGAATKIDDLEERADRLARAITDYDRAEKIIRVFPELLQAAQDFEVMAHGTHIEAPNVKGLARQTIKAAEEIF